MKSEEEKENQTVIKEDINKTQPENAFGLDQKVASLLTYAVGFITGIIVEKKNRVIRFHAFQSTIFFIPAFVIYIVLSIIFSFIPFLGILLGFILWAGFAVIWIFLMVKAYQGEIYELPFIGKIAKEQANK